MSEVILFYLNKQELNWIRYAFTFGRSFSSHSTLSIAFKVSWPPTNLPIKFMLKGLTCSFVFFFRKAKQECSKTKSDNRGGSRGGGRGPRPSLSFRPNWGPKGRKKIFLRPPPFPTLSEGLDPPLNNLEYSSWKVSSRTNDYNKCIKMLPAKHGMLFIQMTTRAKRNEATSKQITLWILQWMD